LPIGVQVGSQPPFAETALLVGGARESATDWPKLAPL
jgi:hypothetical protein